MRSSLRLGSLVAFLVAVPALLVAQRQTRMIYLNVVDQAGAPVLDLKAPDFEVREGAEKRAVTSAGLSNGPMRIMLLLDTGSSVDPFQGQIPEALGAFIDAIPAPHEIGIMSMGRMSRTRLAPTADRAKLKAVTTKFALDAGGVAFFDALREGEDRFQKKPEVRWPVYVLFVTDENEASSTIQNDELVKITTDLMSRGTTVHTAFIEKAGPTPATSIARNLARNTGGALEEVTTPASLAEKLKKIAAKIMADFDGMKTRYQIQYVSDAKYTGSVEAGALRPGVTSKVSIKRGQ